MAVISNCFHIDPDADEYLNLFGYPALNLVARLNEFTISLWVRSIVSGPATRTLIGKATNSTVQYRISMDDDGSDLTVNLGGHIGVFAVDVALGYTLSNGQWHHVVVTASLTAGKLYIDGTYIGPDITLDAALPECTPVDTLIGTHRINDNIDHQGVALASFDEIAIWQAELSSAAVATLTSIGSDHIVDPREDTGSYDKSADLVGFWRCGDGSAEGAGSGGASPTVSDMSGNGHTGELQLNGAPHPTPNDVYTKSFTNFSCDSPFNQLYDSSSSAFTDILPPHFKIVKTDEAATALGAAGFPNVQKRSHFTSVSSDLNLVDQDIFVYEFGRPVTGSTLRNAVFRRVASLDDLQNVPIGIENRGSVFPHSYRTNVATIYARTDAEIEATWIEVQRQARALVLDLTEFGNPALGLDDQGRLKGGVGDATAGGGEDFFLPYPEELIQVQLSSSSLVALLSSSSSFAGLPPVLSSSSIFFIPTSSSSLFVDPFLFGVDIYLSDPTGADAAARLDDDGNRTLFTDLGFLRFGRDPDPLRTWDSLVRFKLNIPKCAEILSALLIMPVHTTELGSDVVLKVRDIYKTAGYVPVDAFSGTADHFYRKEIVWDRLPSTTLQSIRVVPPELSEMMQFFVDRWQYDPANDHFGLWIAEITSDPGARRDASITNSSPFLRVTYRTDRLCPTSSSSSQAGG